VLGRSIHVRGKGRAHDSLQRDHDLDIPFGLRRTQAVKGIVMPESIERTPSPFRLNLEQQKKRARDLLNEVKAGDPGALARLVRAHQGEAVAVPKLAHAQFAIARELRFPSWARLKTHIAAMDRQWSAIAHRSTHVDADKKTLHLRCGHDIQQTLAEAGFAGDFSAHITPYCQGPVTAGPDRHELMARFIVDMCAAASGADAPEYAEVLADEHRQDQVLARMADDYERVVIWMEHDSWDQLMLVRVLAHFASARRPRILELIAVNEYPGGTRFIGVGQLPPESLRLLWEARRPVTPAQLALGANAWQALTSPDPRALAAIAASGTPALPILARALHRHLRELPSIENGLSLTEALILRILGDEGAITLNHVFWMLQNEREPLPFLGDTGFAYVVRNMERASETPLVRAERSPGERGFANQLTLNDVGRAVLSGARDWQDLVSPPRWVGGVQIARATPDWRWDEARRTPMRMAR